MQQTLGLSFQRNTRWSKELKMHEGERDVLLLVTHFI